MRAAYRVLAYLVAVEVLVQAAMIAYAAFGESKFIDGGGTVDKALVESESATFDGVMGYPIHDINGQMVIPVIALLLLVVSFFAGVAKGIQWAAYVVGLVILQVLLGFFGHDLPFLGLLHGINAIALFAVAVIAARRASSVVAAASTAPVA
jgi:hypothetical protein